MINQIQYYLPVVLPLLQVLGLLLVVGALQVLPLVLEQGLEGVDVVLHAAGEHADVGVVLLDQLLVALVHRPVLSLQHLDQLVLRPKNLVTRLFDRKNVLKQLGWRSFHFLPEQRPRSENIFKFFLHLQVLFLENLLDFLILLLHIVPVLHLQELAGQLDVGDELLAVVGHVVNVGVTSASGRLHNLVILLINSVAFVSHQLLDLHQLGQPLGRLDSLLDSVSPGLDSLAHVGIINIPNTFRLLCLHFRHSSGKRHTCSSRIQL